MFSLCVLAGDTNAFSVFRNDGVNCELDEDTV